MSGHKQKVYCVQKDIDPPPTQKNMLVLNAYMHKGVGEVVHIWKHGSYKQLHRKLSETNIHKV